MAEPGRGAPVPRTDTVVRDADWTDEDMAGRDYERVAFLDMDLTELVDESSTFTDCTFTGSRFNASTHTDAAFVNCTFSGCSFFDAAFTHCKLVGSLFTGCSFGLLVVSGGDWSFVGLPGADLRRARISRVRMREADLTGARMQGAVLHHVDLSGASLHRAVLDRADLRGSDRSAVDPLTVSLKGAVIDAGQAIVRAGALGLDVGTDLPPGGR